MSSTPLSVPSNPSRRRRQSNSSVASSPNSQASYSEGRTPHWQKSLSRKRAPTGLSLVTVAKPESGSILPSASDRLPRPRLMHTNSSSSLNEAEGRKVERTDSVSIKSVKKKESDGEDGSGREMDLDEAMQRAMAEGIVGDETSGNRLQGDEGFATRGTSPGTKSSSIPELDKSSPEYLVPEVSTQPQFQDSAQQESGGAQARASTGSGGETDLNATPASSTNNNILQKPMTTSPSSSLPPLPSHSPSPTQSVPAPQPTLPPSTSWFSSFSRRRGQDTTPSVMEAQPEKPLAQPQVEKPSAEHDASSATTASSEAAISNTEPAPTPITTASSPERTSAPLLNITPPTPPRGRPEPESTTRAQSPLVSSESTESTSSEAQLIPERKPVKRSWFGSVITTTASSTKNVVPTSSPTNSDSTTGSSPTQITLTRTTGTRTDIYSDVPQSPFTPSSVDDEVPDYALARPSQTVHSQKDQATQYTTPPPESSSSSNPLVASGDSVNQRLSSLNPSTSRFSLSIPLLGRPKVPLDKALAVAQASGVGASESDKKNTGGGASGSGTVTGTDVVTSPTGIPEEGPQSAEQTTTVENTNLVQSDETSAATTRTIQTSTSWWSYVGLTPSGSQQDVSTLANVDDQVKAAPAESTPDIAATPSNDAPANDSPAPEISVVDAPSSPDARSTDQPAPPEAHKALSMRSQETTNSAWYYPWAWYYSTSATEMETSTDEQETRGRQNTNTGVWEGLTPSEQIKEEALARSSSAPPSSNPTADAQPPLGAAEQIPSSQSTMSVDAFKKDHNPIEGSMASNMSGWSSLFSYAGRTLMAKSIGAGEDGTVKEESGAMEVMDLDDDEGDGEGAEASGGAGSQTQTTTVTHTQSQTVVTKGKPRSSSLLGSASQPVSVINKKSSLSSVRPGTPSPKSSERPKSPAASGSKTPPPPTSAKPNLVLPTWEDTFDIPPRSIVPLPERKEEDEGTLKKGWKFINNVLINPPGGPKVKGKARSAPLSGGSRQRTISERGGLRGRPGRSGLSGRREEGVPGGEGREGVDDWSSFGLGLPRSHETMRKHAPQDGGVKRSRLRRGSVSSSAGPLGDEAEDVLRGCKRVAVLAIHGWFPGAMMRTVLGEPTGTSIKFASMMVQALEEFQEHHGVKFDKVTQMPLEGEGTISKRVDKLYSALTSNEEWISDLHAADVIFVATHSQGSIVSTHLLDRLIQDKHIRTAINVNEAAEASEVMKDAAMDVASGVGGVVAPSSPNLENKKQRVCCLCLCGIHLGPLRYLSSSSLVLPYIQYFESTAARELFEFQNTESQVSKSYVRALRNVLNHGTKMVYTASLNDQVVPIYSGIFHAASHPLILRALYIDGDAYHSSDFLSNLLVLLLRILNSGLSDSGLLVHLSEATAGSLNGVGHSTIYEELGTYSLAVNYLFLTNDGLEEHPELVVEPFNANTEQNDYEIPWALRDLIADERVAYFFGKAFADLKAAFPHWHPKTTILRDIKRKLQPIQRLSNIAASYMDSTSPNSKL